MVDDLSLSHQALTDLFAGGPGDHSDPISDELLKHFEQNGFVFGIPMLSVDQVVRLRSELDNLMTGEQASNPLFYEYNTNEAADPKRRLFHALGAWRVSPAFHDLIFSRRLVRSAERLLGGPVRLWHDQVFVKPARDGAVVTWHQDYSYWTRTVPIAHLTCWIGLDDADEDNGCVQYIPGSHRWPLLPRESLSDGMDVVLARVSPKDGIDHRPVPAVMKAGSASFHHSMTLHGSYENRSERPRRGLVINFIKDGVSSNTDEELLSGVPPIPCGEKLDGRFFPLVSN